MQIPFAACLAFCAFTQPVFAKGPLNPSRIGNWVAGSFTNDQTGAFSHCAATAAYPRGLTLHVSVTRQHIWLLGFTDPAWSLSEGMTYSVELFFDGVGPLRGTGTAMNNSLLAVPMPTTSALITAFRNARIMQSDILALRTRFQMNGTARLLPALVECVKKETNPAIAARSPAPETRAPTQVTPEVEKERNRLLNEAASEHQNCMRAIMKEIAPYSDESAEIVAQVVITRCAKQEQKFVSLGIAVYGASKVDVERIVSERMVQQKKEMVADIVSFRAELAKALATHPTPAPKQDSGAI